MIFKVGQDGDEVTVWVEEPDDTIQPCLVHGLRLKVQWSMDLMAALLGELRAKAGPMPSEPEELAAIREVNSIRKQTLDLKLDDERVPRYTRTVVVQLTDALLAYIDAQTREIGRMQIELKAAQQTSYSKAIGGGSDG